MVKPSGPHQEPQRDQPPGERENGDSCLVPNGYVRLANEAIMMEAAAATVICQPLHLGHRSPTQVGLIC